MQAKSGKLNVFETNRIPEPALAILLGEAEYKPYSGVMILDAGRIRFSVRQWKELIALKILRQHMLGVLNECYENRGLRTSVNARRWLAIWTRIVAGQPEMQFE